MSFFISFPRARSLFWALALALVLSTSAMAGDPCTGYLPIEPGTVVRDVHVEAGRQCYTVDLPSAGTWLVEVTAELEAAAEPEVTVLGCGARAEVSLGGSKGKMTVLDRWASSWLVAVPSAGCQAVCVSAQDPARRLAGFQLTSAFASVPTTKDGDPTEDEPEPDPTAPATGGNPSPTKDGDPTEDEPEPDPTAPATGGHHPPAGLTLYASELCPLAVDDDHADILRCATPVSVGENVSARLGNTWGDDSDTFALRLDAPSTVRVDLRSGIEIEAGLYDRFGHRLQLPASRFPARRLVKTLMPGLYFIRVSSVAGTEGTYEVGVEALVR